MTNKIAMKQQKLWIKITTAALTSVLGTTGSLFCSINESIASPLKSSYTAIQSPEKVAHNPTAELSDSQSLERMMSLDSDRIQAATEDKNNAALGVTSLATKKPQGKPNASQSVKGGNKGGIASWYGPGFHGARTASGERFNQHGLTAAHRSLPFGTKVRVTNVRNGRSVVVRINDRGPHIRGRVIDLSSGAARAIRLGGTAPVKLQVLGI
jgi:rare lipoprotein A (peptidoglycan hydrolase)